MTDHNYASRFEFAPCGRGMVAIWLRHKTAPDEQVGLLWYAEQGRIIGSDPIDVENARRLNAAAGTLNAELARL